MIPLLLIGVGLVYRWFRRRVAWQYKVFFVPFTEATQIVGNVLDAKGFPFHRVDGLSGLGTQTTFELENGELVVVIGGGRDRDQRLVRVEIRPTGRDSRLLAQSLQEKIDEAFLPQGLSR